MNYKFKDIELISWLAGRGLATANAWHNDDSPPRRGVVGFGAIIRFIVGRNADLGLDDDLGIDEPAAQEILKQACLSNVELFLAIIVFEEACLRSKHLASCADFSSENMDELVSVTGLLLKMLQNALPQVFKETVN